MTLTDEIVEARDRLHDAIESALQHAHGEQEHAERVVRYALYQTTRAFLAGFVDEIVWIVPPFPEHEDYPDDSPERGEPDG